MTMRDHRKTDQDAAGSGRTGQSPAEGDLEALFAAGRTAAPAPSAGFLARVLADAEALQAARGAAVAPVAPVMQRAPIPPRGGVMAALRGVFGGWGALGGMLSAAVAGVWIGFAGMERIGLATGGLWGTADSLGTVALLPDAELFALGALE